MLYFFKDYVIEVKTVTKTAGPAGQAATSSQLSIYDFKN